MNAMFPELEYPDCGRGSETLGRLLAAGDILARELEAHGLSPHENNQPCEAGAAMDRWWRATEGLRTA